MKNEQLITISLTLKQVEVLSAALAASHMQNVNVIAMEDPYNRTPNWLSNFLNKENLNDLNEKQTSTNN